MIKDIFSKRKKDVLTKLDKSSKKTWDKEIIQLCKKINSYENYYTTSSCSGRIVIMIDQEKKEEGLFFNVYHDKINLKKFKSDLSKINYSKFVKFKQEPCILHVACKTIDDSKKLLDYAKLAGWKKSGIIASGKRFIVELNSTEKIEFPIIYKNKILVNEDFLKIVIKKSNENLEKSWEKIERLRKLI